MYHIFQRELREFIQKGNLEDSELTNFIQQYLKKCVENCIIDKYFGNAAVLSYEYAFKCVYDLYMINYKSVSPYQSTPGDDFNQLFNYMPCKELVENIINSLKTLVTFKLNLLARYSNNVKVHESDIDSIFNSIENHFQDQIGYIHDIYKYLLTRCAVNLIDVGKELFKKVRSEYIHKYTDSL